MKVTVYNKKRSVCGVPMSRFMRFNIVKVSGTDVVIGQCCLSGAATFWVVLRSIEYE